MDINGLGDIGESINNSDTLAIYNASATAVKKTTLSRLSTWIGDNVSEIRIKDARNDPSGVSGDSDEILTC